ncbi:MAG: hypothetical protein BIP78_0088 [Candidatus Bipolaricaulis sibiricus]|uniref:RanBP2-type domain-containing protein n=1 Tax=Bipolaricaulis sibiricus TaxID=2501609 RepID=A0A410FS69_BIPS1|nr:MAG: hypothetical protein BIP78_0088 [Candidatus Bipolaricaulis sibiricus]
MTKQDIWQWLGPLSHRWGAEELLRDQTAVFVWPATGLAPLARAVYVDQTILHLSVGSHVVAAELNLLKHKLLARLHEISPECGVTDLRFQVRAWERPPHEIVVPAPTAEMVRRARRSLPAGLPPRLRTIFAEAVAWAQARDRAILDAGGWTCPQCDVVATAEMTACPVCGIERSKRGR